MSVASGPWAHRFQPSNRLIYISLILPVVAGILVCFSTSGLAAFLISSAMVISTSILVAIDADRHGEVDTFGRPQDGAMTLFVGMFLFWVIVYPYAFFRRRAFVPPNLGFASILVTVFFVASTVLRVILHPITLPECTSAEVIEVLEKAVRGTAGGRLRAIDGHKELNYNESEGVRYGECVIHLDTEELPAKYSVRWRDKQRHEFEVRIDPPELPSCRSPEVAQLLKSVIRSTPWGAQVTEIEGIREVRYDRGSKVRHGECIARYPLHAMPLTFVVEWIDQDQGQFQIKVFPPEPAPVAL